MNSSKNRKNITGYPSIDKPWLNKFSEESIRADIPDVTIYDYLYKSNVDSKKAIAIKYLTRNITYETLFEKIEECAKAFTALGLKKGDIVTIALPSMPEAAYTIYACNYLGLIANVIHPLASENEILFYLNEVGSEVFIMFSGTYELIKNSLKKTKVRTAVVVSAVESCQLWLKCIYNLKNKPEKLKGNLYDYKKFIEMGKHTALRKERVSPDDPVVISHTGGTTGLPKGVLLSSRNYVSEIWQVTSTMEGGRGDTMLNVLPPFVNYSLTNGFLEPLSLGMTVVLIPKYEPEKIVEYLTKYKPQHINSIPPYWEAILNVPNVEKSDFSFLLNAFYGGEKMADETVEKINALFKKCGSPSSLKSGYGMTELVSAATATYEDYCTPGSVGIPIVKINCKIVDVIDGSEKKYGEEGEICFSGPTVMLGYYKNQEATDELIHIHEDGVRWLHTGDLGYVSEKGEVFITGRLKRIFITKGDDGMITKLFPDRIEKVLLSMDCIDECCVVEKEDPERVHVALGFITMKEGNSFEKSYEAIMTRLKAELPAYMVPVSIQEVSRIPRTSREKTDYRAVKELYVS